MLYAYDKKKSKHCTFKKDLEKKSTEKNLSIKVEKKKKNLKEKTKMADWLSSPESVLITG